jgi:NADPH:quinone reductase-like Zn-dependent oxidoreductase
LPTAGLPAWNAIRGANVGPDSTVLVLSTGGVSLFALQFAVACNARVIVTSSSEDKLRRARELGAAETINYKTNPAWDEQVLTLTEGRGVDLVIETSGAVTFEQSVRVTRVEGTIAVLGWRGGARVTLPINHVQQFKLYIVGGMVGSVADLIAMTRAIAWRKITPVIAAVYPFDEIQSAYQYLAAGDVFGKIVVRI